MAVAIYCRVSTEDQAEAKTIENQVAFAQNYCMLNDLQIYKFYLDDGVSGAIPVLERPAGKQLFRDAQMGYFKAVYVYRLDRLARTTLDLLATHERLSKLGVSLKSMTENFDTFTPSGKFFMTTLGSIAEIERATIAERMQLGKARAIKEGRWPGGPPPYGYQLENKRLVIAPGEAVVVRLIFNLYTIESMDTVAIADYLTAAGYPSPALARKGTGTGVWYSSKVWGILTSSTYAGEFIYGKNRRREKQQKIACPAIVSAQQWAQAQRKLKQNFFNARRNAQYHYLLRGLVKCGLCGRSYCGDGSHSKGRYHYYRCTGSSSFRGKLVKKCTAKYVRAEVLEGIVWRDMLQYLKKQGKLLAELQQLFIAAKQGYSSSDLQELEKKLAAKGREKERVMAVFRKGLINHQEVERQLGAIVKETQMLQRRQGRLLQLQKEALLLQAGQFSIENISQLLQQKLLTGDIAIKREMAALLVESITVHTTGQQGKSKLHVVINYRF